MRTKTIQESICWIRDHHDPTRLFSRQVLLEYQPGNGSRYVVSFVQVPGGAEEGIGCFPGSFVVSLADGACSGRCCVLAPAGYLAPNYVAEKLRLPFDRNEDDVLVLTELFGHILGRQTPSAQDESGPYSPELQVEIIHNE
jgi:hypothetical protein